MNQVSLPFLSGSLEPTAGPLGRFLPPAVEGILPRWLQGKVPPGSWLLDPFGASPALAIEAAQSGYRVLVAANNPIIRFVLEVLAGAPQASEFQATLAELASAYKGGERIEPHIQELYLTTCVKCGQKIPARAFIWEKGAKAPSNKIYSCPHCNDEGERATDEADLQKLTEFAGSGLPRARALERVTPLDDPARPDVEEALNCYLNRPLYALFTLINKLDGLVIPPGHRSLLTALLLSACDQANTLWMYPTTRARPRLLNTPGKFRENNLWIALEEAIDDWACQNGAVPVCHWPEQPPESGGISLFQGRMRDLSASIPSIPAEAIVGIFPRPNQAFWTLSALWSGWLWGREAVSPLKNALVRRRYDWNWHATALEAALKGLPEHIRAGVPFFGLLTEVEAPYLSAALLAGDRTGFSLKSLALRPEVGIAEVYWQSAPGGLPVRVETPEEIARKGVKAYLSTRGEPVPYLLLHATLLAAQAEARALGGSPGSADTDPLAQVNTRLRAILSDRTLLTRFGGGDHTLETGSWWLSGEKGSAPSFSDQVEMEIVRYLMKNPGCRLEEIDEVLCASHPGLFTPTLDFTRAVMESYGIQEPPGSGQWHLRDQDAPAARRADLAEVSQRLHQLGAMLGYRSSGESPLKWEDEFESAYLFFPTASALIGRFFFDSEYPPERCFVVLPGSRSNLVTYKLRQNPLLFQAQEQGWRFMKFRHLRSLSDNPLMNRETFRLQVDLDPPEYKAAQLVMI